MYGVLRRNNTDCLLYIYFNFISTRTYVSFSFVVDQIQNTQCSTHKGDSDLETNGGLFIQLDREGQYEYESTMNNPSKDSEGLNSTAEASIKSEENLSDGSDIFEKTPECPREEAIKTNLSRLWTSLGERNNITNGLDEGYSSINSNRLDSIVQIDLRQHFRVSQNTDDETDINTEDHFDNVHTEHQSNVFKGERTNNTSNSPNFYQMNPDQLLVSAGLSPTAILKDIVSDALKGMI